MILNGQVWQSPSLLEAITQWLDNDTWILLSTPYKAAHGGTAMLPSSYQIEDGIWSIYFNAESLERYLIKNGWVLTNIVIPFAAPEQQ
jgi:hypothetical protein